MEKKMNVAKVEAHLFKKGADLDVLNYNRQTGVFTLRREFFYTFGNSAVKIADAVKKAYPGAMILKMFDVWKPFRGGAPIEKSSHFLVKFKFPGRKR